MRGILLMILSLSEGWWLFFTGKFSSAVLFAFGVANLVSSSIGSSNGEFCHQTDPLPSMIPLPWTVIPPSLLNSSHCNSPEPHALAYVGAIIVPSSCRIFYCDLFQTQIIPFDNLSITKLKTSILCRFQSWMFPQVFSLTQCKDCFKIIITAKACC